MFNLTRRVAALEAAGPSDLSPSAKEWLGWPLTETERKMVGVCESTDERDTRHWSPEAKAWLGVN